MRITLDVDGKPVQVEVDLDAGTVRVGDRSFPAKVVRETETRVELEIAGERVTVEGWGTGVPSPSEPVAVDGERFQVRATVETSAAPGTRAVKAAPPTRPSEAATKVAEGEGTPIAPPMPGKVVEVRVHEGEHVAVGQVLLVLEAMKMRNELTAPVAGIVRALRVGAGANVRAREPMLRISPN